MTGTFEFATVQFGLERPLLMLAIPVVAVLVGYVVGLGRDDNRRHRLLMFGSRLLIVSLLITAAAGPFTVSVRETPGDPQATLLIDESNSMTLSPTAVETLANGIEDQGVPVSVQTVATDNRSQIGDAIISNVRQNGSVLVVSDGQVTGGRSLARAGEFAQQVNGTIYGISPAPNRTEAYVKLEGPATTGVGTRNRFIARVDGVNINDREYELTVSVDGEVINTTTVTGSESIAIPQTFEETGTYRITARLTADDRFAVNNVFRQTVRVVERPRILYIAQEPKPFGELLSQTYNVDQARRVPSADELDPYLAVVIQDTPAAAVGNVSALQQHVIDGGGLVVVGGPNAYTNGGYESSPLSVMLPVRQGSGQQASRIILTVDISTSARAGLDTQKALALSVINQLGDDNRVGIVAFNDQPFLIAEPRRLGDSRALLQDRIRRLQSDGGTRIASGLSGAGELLEQGGSVILLSDGQDQTGGSLDAATRLREQGTRVISVGVGQDINEQLLRDIAARSDGGTYFRADETDRLRLLFGDESRQFQGNALTIVDSTQFITRGVTLTAAPEETHALTVKQGADLLIAGGSNDPALATWSYGLGRSVSITSYASDGTLGGLLSAPDSLVLTRSVNWAIGDPTRGQTGITNIEPARVGQATTVTYVGETRPEVTSDEVRFVRVGENSYEARIVPSETGYDSILERTYAVNYPRELGGFGPNRALEQAARATGGQTFEPGETAAIADAIERQYRQVRSVREDWDWVFLTVGLLIYLTEVVLRRLNRFISRPSRVVTPW